MVAWRKAGSVSVCILEEQRISTPVLAPRALCTFAQSNSSDGRAELMHSGQRRPCESAPAPTGRLLQPFKHPVSPSIQHTHGQKVRATQGLRALHSLALAASPISIPPLARSLPCPVTGLLSQSTVGFCWMRRLTTHEDHDVVASGACYRIRLHSVATTLSYCRNLSTTSASRLRDKVAGHQSARASMPGRYLPKVLP